MITEAIEKASNGQDLTENEMMIVVDQLMSGSAKQKEISSLLTALHTKGETVDELVGAAKSMRKHMHSIRSHREQIVDTCGTGGSGMGTFNISTAAAIVAASAGASVAKHGNRASTSPDWISRCAAGARCQYRVFD